MPVGRERLQIQKRKGTFDGTGQRRTFGKITVHSGVKNTRGNESMMSKSQVSEREWGVKGRRRPAQRHHGTGSRQAERS